MNIVQATVARLAEENWTGLLVGAPIQPALFAWRRWHDPLPGRAVIVVTSPDDWTAGRTSAQYPTVRAMVVASPHEGQEDAEAIAVTVGDKVRSALHTPEHGLIAWDGLRVISSMLVGSSMAEVEGHEAWRVRTLTFEVEVG